MFKSELIINPRSEDGGFIFDNIKCTNCNETSTCLIKLAIDNNINIILCKSCLTKYIKLIDNEILNQ